MTHKATTVVYDHRIMHLNGFQWNTTSLAQDEEHFASREEAVEYINKTFPPPKNTPFNFVSDISVDEPLSRTWVSINSAGTRLETLNARIEGA